MKSKYDRAFASSDELNAGNWYLPHPQLAPWVQQFLFELSAFPRGKNDDWLDAWTQAWEVLSGAGVPDYSMFTRENADRLIQGARGAMFFCMGLFAGELASAQGKRGKCGAVAGVPDYKKSFRS